MLRAAVGDSIRVGELNGDLALPKPKVLCRLFRTLAEYGVANLPLINSTRVEKSYW